ncbi:outer membrane protein TolC [Mucilaginibacter gracilis]|uniref:Outer membrane protein TolC n=1 Tax=Mucilaginibacter gracilis TaxID=423350 RepID=A0A495IY97_9SPHI|nr:TolC family protein [Mucilaginibacter gracilis]RKR81483.1 outer membrane protein TolC [Mucilaginibacter gracilis]
MVKHRIIFFSFVLMLCALAAKSQQKTLTLKDAIQTALANYGTIKAKANYIKASAANVTENKREQLPDFNISAQQDFGTVNSNFGPSYGYRGFSVSSSGPSLPSQNWNAAFGALYLANINWDFFSFGKARQKVKVAQSILNRDQADLSQEQFQHQVRVSTAYLNLLAAQQLTRAQQKNLDRASEILKVVVVRAKNGLNAGVDSSLAGAEVSSAKIALTNAHDFEQTQASQLAQLLGVTQQNFTLDSLFVTAIPKVINPQPAIKLEQHPILQFYQNRIDYSDALAKYYKTFNYPTFSLFGIMQGKGSGFGSAYGANNLNDYTANYGTGVNPTRGNYLLGVGLIWNLTSPLRVKHQVEAQRYNSLGLKDEYNLVDQNLQNQSLQAETRIDNALKNYHEAPVGYKAASDAFLQKSVLYKNGLTTIVDVTQALYALNRAETDRYIAYNNVWQALLYKAASNGDFGIFINEF